jgi:FkbM family methyltransferase
VISLDPVVSLQWVELALLRLLSSIISCRRMIDVGAHHGHSLQPFLELGWRVTAFEPIAANRQRLESLDAGNGRLVIRPEAVSNETGQRLLHLALTRDGALHEYYHSLEFFAEDEWHRKGPSVPIATVSLDDLVDRGDLPSRIGVLKVDTEGHDLAVLQGASHLRVDVVAVEFWCAGHSFGPSPSPAEAMIRLMASRGYPAYLVLCHDGDATRVLDSTLSGTRDDSWGNIFFFHRSALDHYRQVKQHRDWRFVMQMSSTCDGLRGQLHEKEAVIQELAAAVREKEAVIRSLARARENVLSTLARWARSALRRTGELAWKH